LSEQAEQLRRGYELLSRDGVKGIADLLDPDFEVQTAPELPEAGTYKGEEAFETLIGTLSDPFEEIQLHPERFIELRQNLLIVPLHILGRGKSSGLPLDLHVVHVWTMRNRRALQLRVFTSFAAALEALLRDAYEAYNHGDFDSILALLDPAVELYEERELPDVRVRRGPDGVADFFAETAARWQTFSVQVEEVVEVADDVLVVAGVMRGRGGLSGAEVESPFGHVYELRDWKAARIAFYFDRETAVEAARSIARPGQAP
jgi:uncharacterized protein